MEKNEELKIKALKEFAAREDMFEIVDFLNKSFKDTDYIFGLKKLGEKMTLTIYDSKVI